MVKKRRRKHTTALEFPYCLFAKEIGATIISGIIEEGQWITYFPDDGSTGEKKGKIIQIEEYEGSLRITFEDSRKIIVKKH